MPQEKIVQHVVNSVCIVAIFSILCVNSVMQLLDDDAVNDEEVDEDVKVLKKIIAKVI